MQIPLHYDARPYQTEAMRALEAGVTYSVWCWARRAGKDLTAFAYATKKMVEQPMNSVLVFPTKEQGREAFWENIENDGFKTLDHIPQSLIARKDNNAMKLTLINGSTFSLLGSKDPDALRGANGRLYILSEFVDIPGGVTEVIEPIIEVNGGQMITQSTPKIDGISGGTFKNLFDLAKTDSNQFASLITAREYLSEETLERIRQRAIAKYGNDFKFRQEYLCDWGQASESTYYGQILKAMEANQRIGMYPYDKNHPVYTVRDIGMSDSTSILFFQYFLVMGRPQVRIIDYYETHDIGNEAIVRFVQSKPYNYGWHFFPHDAAVRDSDAIQRIEKSRELGLVNSSLLRRTSRDDGINRVIEQLPKAHLHKPTTSLLITKLYLYKRKYNPLTGDYEGPEHKTESHAADGLRYLYDAIDQEFNQETCELYMSQASQEDSYESELATTNFYSPQS